MINHKCNGKSQKITKIVCHSRTVLNLAKVVGWLPGASYTRLRDIREVEQVGLIDINWNNYDFKKHLQAVKTFRPLITIANDLVQADNLTQTLDQAYELLEWTQSVVIVPKDPKMGPSISHLIPNEFILGYSVPTKYGSTQIPLEYFRGRKVHLLGGRPDIQRSLADSLNVISLDINRFTLDAKFGDFFDGETFRPHPVGGYHRCLHDSILNIESLWRGYTYGKDCPPAVCYKKGNNGRPKTNQELSSRKL